MSSPKESRVVAIPSTRRVSQFKQSSLNVQSGTAIWHHPMWSEPLDPDPGLVQPNDIAVKPDQAQCSAHYT